MRRRVVVLSVVLLGACGDPGRATETDGGAGGVEGGSDARSDAPANLEAVVRAPRYALVGEPVSLDGSASVGAAAYRWSFGDGRGWDEPRTEPDAEVTYEAPGRYSVVLVVSDTLGRTRSASAVVSVTHPAIHRPSQSNSVAVALDRPQVAVVSPDSHEVSVFDVGDDGGLALAHRAAVPREPRSVVAIPGGFAVACREGDAVAVLDEAGRTTTVPLPAASRPVGVAAAGDSLFVTLSASGGLARLDRVGGSWQHRARLPAIVDAHAVAALPDGRLAVSRLRSPDRRGELALVAPSGGVPVLVPLAFDPQAGSDTENGGVPSYLLGLAVAPTGLELAVASLQANLVEGVVRNGVPLDFQTTLRAVTSFVDLERGAEPPGSRKQFDDRGLASSLVYSSRGDWLFVAMRGNRTVERWDALRRSQSGTIAEVGFAPNGVALSADDRWLFVDAYLSRELVVYDAMAFDQAPEPVARASTVSREPLAPEVLRGKQLFNDAADERLAKDGYLACAHCHLDGDSDARVWDFTQRGEGLRNTATLLGRGGRGPLHWSANFDEVQDFENDIRGAFAGKGLLSEEDWLLTRDTLGTPKAGRSEDLDALAAYVASLTRHPPSPYRLPDGSLGEAALRGRTLFESPALGCTTCHSGPELTDSGWLAPGVPLLHDVGTLTPTSGGRLGGPLTGIDTPSLHGLWHSAPYLHDGSALTLRDVLVTRNPDGRHGAAHLLSESDLEDLLEYLLCLDGRR